MSSKIYLLPEALVNKIAAGEVIERPASVVKELLENSLDANAKKIIIELEAGGKKLIRVVDDGEGMSEDDALLALERHATSKIRTEKDLFSIRTLGFRGEALPSICAVSKMELATREKGAELGVKIRCEAGTIKEVKKTAMPQGTRVEVRNLFYNVPARRKFLKTTETELGHIIEFTTRLALSHPEVGFELYHNQHLLLRASVSKDFFQRCWELLGAKIVKKLLPVEKEYPFFLEKGDLKIFGFISPPELTFSTTRHLYVYINRRYVRDKLLTHSLLEAYRSFIPKNRYPAVVLFLKMPAEAVDVNVHPSKMEVRFGEPGKIYQAIKDVLKGGLRSRHWDFSAPGLTEHQKGIEEAIKDFFASRKEKPAQKSFSASVFLPQEQKLSFPAKPPRQKELAEVEKEAEQKPAQMGFQFNELKVLGQFHSNYILLEAPEELIILDQHAVHERINFEKLKAQLEAGNPARQNLLFSEVVELNWEQAQKISENMELIQRLGFEIEPFGGTSFIIKAAPAILKDTELSALINDLADELLELGKTSSIEEKIHHLLSVIACHSSIRAGKILSEQEIKALLEEMDKVGFAGTCPHGRPAIWRISVKELEKKFSR